VPSTANRSPRGRTRRSSWWNEITKKMVKMVKMVGALVATTLAEAQLVKLELYVESG